MTDARKSHRQIEQESAEAQVRIAELEALREGGERFLAIANYIYDWVSWVGTDGTLRWVNPAVERMTGYTVGECLAMPDFPLPIIHEEDREAIRVAFRKAVEGTAFNDLPFRIRTKDGRTRWGAVSWQPIYSNEGICLGHCASVRDITDREEAEATYRWIVETANEGIWSIGPERRTVYVNRRMAEMLGRRAEEMIGRPVTDFMFEEDLPGHLEREESRGQDPGGKYEQRFRRADGSAVWCLVSATAMTDETGGFQGSFSIVTDIFDRKQAEEALRLSESRLNEAEAIAHVGYWERDLATDGITWSEETCRIFGLRPQERQIEGPSLLELVHPEDRDRVEKAIREAIEGAKPCDLDYRIVRPDGEIRFVHSQGRLSPATAGKPARMFGSIMDITERNRAEQSLWESEERFRYIIKYDPSAIAVFDKDFRYILVSDRFLNDYKVAEQDIIGRHHYEVFPEMPQRWKDVHQRVFAGAVEKAEEDAFVRADGSVDYNRWECRPWYDAWGNIGGIIMYTEVITERKCAELALRASEERFRALATTIPVGIYLTNAGGRCLYVNPAWCEMAGLSMEQAVGEGWVKGVHPDDQERIGREWYKAMRSKGSWSMEYRLQAPGGKITWVYGVAAALQDERGMVTGYVGVNTDVTARKQAEEQLKALNDTLEQRVAERTAEAESRAAQLQRLAAELTRAEQRERQRLGQILHDNLQQLLVAAKFNVDSLRRRLTDREQQRFVQKVNELLDESLATSRSLTAELSPPILYEGNLAQVLHWLGRRAKEKYGLSVAVTADEQADPASQEVRVLLFQAVQEFLLNITKHAGVDRARVSLTRLGTDQVHIVVADEGVGFDPAQKQVEKVGTASGSRFGLFSIRERLELMGGWMQIDSQPGLGTRVVVAAPRRLPGEEAGVVGGPAAEQPVEVGRAAGRGAAYDEKIIHVMLADDHAVVRDGLARLLQTQPDMEVAGQAADGQEAVTLALQVRPEVILMDVSMPVMNGVEATRRITQQLPEVRVIGLSMHAQEDVAAQMMAAGAIAYLTKTTPPEALLAAIRECVARLAGR